MANPFLVLGGVAVGVITAGIGVLAVPGWIESAQDSAAINDVAQVTIAQEAAQMTGGTYLPTVDDLRQAASVKISPSSGVRLHASTNAEEDHFLTVARSSSGTYFARLSGSSAIGSSEDLEEAVVNAGTAVTDWVTAEGVPLPDPTRLGNVARTNFALNPAVSSTFNIHATTVGGEARIVHDPALAALDLPTSFRRIQWGATGPTNSPAGVAQRSIPVSASTTYTLSAYAASSFTLTTGIRMDLVYLDADGNQISTSPGTTAGHIKPPNEEWRRLSRTVTTPAGTAALNMTIAFSGPQPSGANGWVGATAFLAEEGSELRKFFYGGSGRVDGDKAHWTGGVGESTSILIQ